MESVGQSFLIYIHVILFSSKDIASCLKSAFAYFYYAVLFCRFICYRDAQMEPEPYNLVDIS